jgi:hypothetical protein
VNISALLYDRIIECRGQGALVQPGQTLYSPPDCDMKSEEGDHVMLRFSLKDATAPEASPIFQMQSWEQQHFVLGASLTPAAFSSGLLGMCVGEKRLLTSDSTSFDVSASEAAKVPTMVSTVELVSLTTAGDYHIFNLIQTGDVSGILEMVDGKAGINAVDQVAHSNNIDLLSCARNMVCCRVEAALQGRPLGLLYIITRALRVSFRWAIQRSCLPCKAGPACTWPSRRCSTRGAPKQM